MRVVLPELPWRLKSPLGQQWKVSWWKCSRTEAWRVCPSQQFNINPEVRVRLECERVFHLLLVCSRSFALTVCICFRFTSTFTQSLVIHICWVLMNVCSLEHFPGSVRGVQSQPTSQQPPTQAKARNQAQKQIKNALCDVHHLQCETEGDSLDGSLAGKS